jgi:hypothetical protein
MGKYEITSCVQITADAAGRWQARNLAKYSHLKVSGEFGWTIGL